MERQFKVINRVSRKEQIFNSDELHTFFRYRHDADYIKEGKRVNEQKDYAVSVVKSKKETIFETLGISLIAVASVILITKLILQWIII